MSLAVKVGVTLPAVSGWERNLYRPRRPTAQRLDDELRGGGAILAAFGYAPLPGPDERAMASADSDNRVQRLERLVAELTNRLNVVQQAVEISSGRSIPNIPLEHYSGDSGAHKLTSR